MNILSKSFRKMTASKLRIARNCLYIAEPENGCYATCATVTPSRENGVGRDSFEMLYKNYCLAVIPDPIIMNDQSTIWKTNEYAIIQWQQFTFSFRFARYRIDSRFLFFFFTQTVHVTIGTIFICKPYWLIHFEVMFDSSVATLSVNWQTRKDS